MRGAFVFSAAVLLAGAPAEAGSEPGKAGGPVKAGDGPRIELPERSHDFGRVPNDRTAEHVFKVNNSGSKPLIVTRVRSSCGCTAAMMESSVILPGKSGKLRVSYNLRGRKGRATRTVSLHSNDPALPVVQVSITAEAYAPGEKEEKKPDPRKRAHEKREKLAFKSECLKCHGPKSGGQKGGELFASACAACHGSRGGGVKIGDDKIGPALIMPMLSVKTREGLNQIISVGTGHPAMPGYGVDYGGPLNKKQIKSLVDVILRQWQAK